MTDQICLEERFTDLQRVMFETMVTGAFEGEFAQFENTQQNVLVKVMNTASIMVNREIDCGYWDFPITIATDEPTFKFICFFDWRQNSIKDNQYVRAVVSEWPSHPEAVGKHVLIDAKDVRYELASK